MSRDRAFVSAPAGVGDGVGEHSVEHVRHRVGTGGWREQRRRRQAGPSGPARRSGVGDASSGASTSTGAGRGSRGPSVAVRWGSSGDRDRGAGRVGVSHRANDVGDDGARRPPAREQLGLDAHLVGQHHQQCQRVLAHRPAVGVGTGARHGELGALGDERTPGCSSSRQRGARPRRSDRRRSSPRMPSAGSRAPGR